MKRIEDVLKRMSWGAVVLTASVALALAGCGDSDSGGGDTTGQDGVTEDGNTLDGTGTDATDSGGGTDTGGNDADTTQTDEICDNGIDDDGDGATDCDDSDCTGDPACPEKEIEICDDGIDNDGDSLIDCFDPSCQSDPACFESICDDGIDNDGDGQIDGDDPDCPDVVYPSCDDFFFCAVEEGCACTFGVDCPTEEAAETQCYQNCSQNTTCAQICFSEMDPFFQEAFNTWQTCLQENCQDAPNQEAFVDCYVENCFEELATCYYTGPETECTYYFTCASQCPSGAAGQACQSACFNDLNKEAALDLVDWDECRFNHCDADDNGTADSTECILTASFLACGSAEVAGTCRDWGAEEGTGCGDLLTCWTSCESLGDSECLDACLVAASNEAFDAAGPAAACMISTCGTTTAELTTACMAAALANECAAEFAECSGGTPAEICDNEIDDDGDGDVDCDDADCAEDAACAPTTFDARLIHLVSDAPAVDVFVNGAPSGISDLGFGQGTPYVSLPGGEYSFAASATGDAIEDALLTVDPITLENGKSYTVAAYGLLESIAPLMLEDNRMASVGEGQIHVRAVHAAVGVGQVDILAVVGGTPAPLLSDVDYGKATDYLAVPAGVYTVGIDVDADDVPDYTYDLPELTEGTVVTAYAVATNESVSIFAQLEDGSVMEITPNAVDPE